MQLYQMYSDSRKIYGQVIYVTKDGPAYPAGLKRGDLFTTVNGTTLTMDNYSALLFGESTVMKLGIVDENYIHQRDITVTLKQFAESPIILDSIYSIEKPFFKIYNLLTSIYYTNTEYAEILLSFPIAFGSQLVAVYSLNLPEQANFYILWIC